MVMMMMTTGAGPLGMLSRLSCPLNGLPCYVPSWTKAHIGVLQIIKGVPSALASASPSLGLQGYMATLALVCPVWTVTLQTERPAHVFKEKN